MIKYEIINCEICGIEKEDNNIDLVNFVLNSGLMIKVCKDCLSALLKRRHNRNQIIKSGLSFI